VQGARGAANAGGGKRRLGLSGRVPDRVDAATKAGLLDLLDDALGAGWPLLRACHELELAPRRAHRWIARRARGRLTDRSPGGSPMHGLLPEEAAEILALFEEWGETDRSHRKLAHRGSYLGRVWVSPSSVRRVLFLADQHFRPLPRPGKSVRRPFPEWVSYTPNSIWIYDTTHFTAAGMAVLIIEDLVSRKWITEIVSVEETHTQVELAFTAALEDEGLLALVDRGRTDGLVDIDIDDEHRPILLAVSDNGPQMTSGSTREFMALCAIAQHFGRPGTPTDQAWIESLNGHLKAEYPHLLAIRDPATLRAELAVTREHYNGIRLHAGIGYVTPNDEHEGRGEAIRKQRQAGLEQARLRRLAWHRQHRQDQHTPGPDDVG
jgi:putative transposase